MQARRFIYSKHSDFHYMHGEVDFPVCLDRFFHVQTNKSRYTIDERMGEVLSLHFNKHLIALKRDHRGSIDRFREAEAARQSASLAEELSKRAAPLLPQPPMDEAAKQAADKMREAAMAEEKQRAIEALSQQVQAANDRAMEARNRGDDGAAEEAATEVRALLDQQEEWFKRIESRWSSRAPTRLDEASLLSMELYAMQDRGDEAHITVNTDTRFHERVYGPRGHDTAASCAARPDDLDARLCRIHGRQNPSRDGQPMDAHPSGGLSVCRYLCERHAANGRSARG